MKTYAKCNGEMREIKTREDGTIDYEYKKQISFDSVVFPGFLNAKKPKLLTYDEIKKESLPGDSAYWNWGLFEEDIYTTTTQNVTLFNNDEHKNVIVNSDFTFDRGNSVNFTVKYEFTAYKYTFGITYDRKLTLEYVFSLVFNHYPLKKNTILDVLLRICQTVEPLREGQKPRFYIKGVLYDDVTGEPCAYIDNDGFAFLDDDPPQSAINTVLREFEKGEMKK